MPSSVLKKTVEVLQGIQNGDPIHIRFEDFHSLERSEYFIELTKTCASLGKQIRTDWGILSENRFVQISLSFELDISSSVKALFEQELFSLLPDHVHLQVQRTSRVPFGGEEKQAFDQIIDKVLKSKEGLPPPHLTTTPHQNLFAFIYTPNQVAASTEEKQRVVAI